MDSHLLLRIQANTSVIYSALNWLAEEADPYETSFDFERVFANSTYPQELFLPAFFEEESQGAQFIEDFAFVYPDYSGRYTAPIGLTNSFIDRQRVLNRELALNDQNQALSLEVSGYQIIRFVGASSSPILRSLRQSHFVSWGPGFDSSSIPTLGFSEECLKIGNGSLAMIRVLTDLSEALDIPLNESLDYASAVFAPVFAHLASVAKFANPDLTQPLPNFKTENLVYPLQGLDLFTIFCAYEEYEEMHECVPLDMENYYWDHALYFLCELVLGIRFDETASLMSVEQQMSPISSIFQLVSDAASGNEDKSAAYSFFVASFPDSLDTALGEVLWVENGYNSPEAIGYSANALRAATFENPTVVSFPTINGLLSTLGMLEDSDMQVHLYIVQHQGSLREYLVSTTSLHISPEFIHLAAFYTIRSKTLHSQMNCF